MNPEYRQLRLHRVILLCAGATYFVWWFLVRLTLPGAFNPFVSRAVVVACFFLAFAASYLSKSVAQHLATWLALCCSLATAHYFYLFDHNQTDLNWVIGSYVTVIVICAVLQSARALFWYSLFVASLSVALLLRGRGLAFVVFFPGMLTILLFANIGLRSRLRLLDQLQESREKIESLFDAGFEGIVVHEQGIIREANGALSRLSGYSREELIGRDIAELATPEPQLSSMAQVIDPNESPYEGQVFRRDGVRVAAEMISKRYVLDGQQVRLVAIRDLTARKRAEAALLFANQELESFSYSVAHDLRAPLRAMDGFSQILLEDYAPRLDQIARGHLQKVQACARRMGELIDDLLKLSRVSRSDLVRQRLDFSQLALTVCNQLQSRNPERKVECSIQPGLVVEGDRQLLLILLENLIGNAWKFTAKTAAPRIEMKAQASAEGTVYSLRDNGAGFDMRFVDKLFTPFERLHEASEYPGTGIGLATVQRIVQRHGGRVWAEAVVNRGATFHLVLQTNLPV